MIRLAVNEDLPALVDMGMEAIPSIPRYKDVIKPNRESMASFFEGLLSNPSVFFVVLGEPGQPYGMLAASVGLHHWTAESTITGLLWWVKPEKRGGGLALLKAFFVWGETMGVTTYQIGASSKRVAKLYKRYGFQLVEEFFVRRAK